MISSATVDYQDIEALLMERNSKNTVMPRYTPAKWWECDVCEITPAGYVREFEIKLSRSDFRADADKQREVFPRPFGAPVEFENKHALLAAGDPRGPSYFYFVAPAGLLTEQDIPLWAGFIEVSRQLGRNPYARTVKEAPRLHKVKADANARQAMTSCAYGRLHYVWSTWYLGFRGERAVEEQLAARAAENA